MADASQQFMQLGDDAPFIRVLLGDDQPIKRIEGEPGAVAVKTMDVDMEVSLEGGLKETVGRLFVGESLMVSIYTVKPGKTGTIWFAAPNPGGVQRLDIKPNQPWWVQFDGFICGGNVKVEAKIPKELKAAAFGGEGVLMQYITTEGDQDGIAFIDGGGSILPLDLKEGETIKVDTGCVMAFQDSVKYSADFVLDPGMLKDWRRLKNGLLQAMLGGEGIVFATLTGPGRCYIESLPHARRRGRMQDETKEGSGANITEQLAGLIRTIGSQK